MNKNKEIAILYSGGADSTVAAILMASKFKKIHLLTFNTSFLTNVEKTKINVGKIKTKFKHINFIHKIINIEKIYNLINRTNYLQDLFKYKLFKVYSFDLNLRLSMMIATILYCKRYNIKNVAHGINRYAGIEIPSQMKNVLEQFNLLFKRNEITLLNPVYDYKDKHPFLRVNLDPKIFNENIQNAIRTIPDTSKKLYELGITNTKDIKMLNTTKYSNQVECGLYFFHIIWCRFYFFQLYDYHTFKKLSVDYTKDKLEVARKIFNYIA